MTAFYVILLFSLWKLVRILICFLLVSTSLPHFFSLSINSLFVRHSSRWYFARHSQGFLNQSSLSSVFIVDDSAAITGNCGTSHFPKTDNFVRKKIDFCDIHARSGQRFWNTDFFRSLFYNSYIYSHITTLQLHYQSHLWCFARFGTIRTIHKTWKTPMGECYFYFTKSNSSPWVFFIFFKLCTWY